MSVTVNHQELDTALHTQLTENEITRHAGLSDAELATTEPPSVRSQHNEPTAVNSEEAAHPCAADAETVATFGVLMDHKHFIQTAVRDIAVLEATSRELEDFVQRADEYKDEYFDIKQFVSKVGHIWKDRLPPPQSREGREESGNNGVATITGASPSKVRPARIFPNQSAILVDSQDRNHYHAERLRTEDEAFVANTNSDCISATSQSNNNNSKLNNASGLTRRMLKNEERRRIFEEAMKVRVSQQNSLHQIRLAAGGGSEAMVASEGAHSTSGSMSAVSTTTPTGGGPRASRGSITLALNGAPRPSSSNGSYKGNINTTVVSHTSMVHLPPLTSAMTGTKASALPPHLRVSADGSKMLQRRPDALGVLSMTSASHAVHATPAGLNRSEYPNTSNAEGTSPTETANPVGPLRNNAHLSTVFATSPSRVRPFSSDLTEPALSSFSPAAFYNNMSAAASSPVRAPEVERAAKVLQQQARDRKAASDRARALELYGEDGANTLLSEAETGAVGGNGLSSATGRTHQNVADKTSKEIGTSAVRRSLVRHQTLDRLLAEQESEILQQERNHDESYVPMLERYFEYHDMAQRKLDAIAQLTGMDGRRVRGMGIPPRPSSAEGSETEETT